MADPRPLNPDTWAQLFPTAFTRPNTLILPQNLGKGPGQCPQKRPQDPKRHLLCQITARKSLLPNPRPAVLSCLPPSSSPEARSGEGRPWLVHFLLHCLPDNGQSSTKSDHGLTTPQTQIRAKWVRGDCGGRKLSARPDDQRNATWTKEGGGGGKQSKDVLGPDNPHHPMLDTGPNTQREQGLKLRHTCQPAPVPCLTSPYSRRGYEAMATHRVSTCCPWQRQTLSQAALQVPCPIRPWRREVCTKCEIILPGNEGSFPRLTSEWDPRPPQPVSLLIHPPCSSRTCACTWPFSSSQPPTTGAVLREGRVTPCC